MSDILIEIKLIFINKQKILSRINLLKKMENIHIEEIEENDINICRKFEKKYTNNTNTKAEILKAGDYVMKGLKITAKKKIVSILYYHIFKNNRNIYIDCIITKKGHKDKGYDDLLVYELASIAILMGLKELVVIIKPIGNPMGREPHELLIDYNRMGFKLVTKPQDYTLYYNNCIVMTKKLYKQ